MTTEMEGVLMPFGFVLVLEPIVTELTLVLLFRFMAPDDHALMIRWYLTQERTEV